MEQRISTMFRSPSAEEIGIGTRGRFLEESGHFRDIVQNHMMQLLSLVAMEPPFNLQAESIHDEKVKVLKSIRAFPTKKINTSFATWTIWSRLRGWQAREGISSRGQCRPEIERRNIYRRTIHD